MATDGAPQPARFITFEGGEGVGKSTQVRRLVEALGQAGHRALGTREPGGTPKAEAIRSFILQGRSESWGVGGEAVLFAAARRDHVKSLIAPSLADGKWVICDRFADSTRAYQGLSDDSGDRFIDALEFLALDSTRPDLTLVLDMEPDLALERAKARALEDGMPALADRFEKEDLAFHHRLRDTYLAIADLNPSRCVVIPANQSEDALETEIWDIILRRFPHVGEGGEA